MTVSTALLRGAPSVGTEARRGVHVGTPPLRWALADAWFGVSA